MNSRRTPHIEKRSNPSSFRASTATGVVIALMLLAFTGVGCADDDGELEATSLNELTIVDLTHSFNSETIFWPTDEIGFVMEEVFKGTTEAGFYYEANTFRTAEHGGTHLDAPIHFAKGGQSNEQIPLERLVGSAIVVNVSEQSAADRDYLISVKDLEEWESRHGKVPARSIVLFRTGYSKYWSNRSQYLGTTETGAAAVPKLHFPGISPELATWLTTKREISSVGIDTPSIDRGQSADFESHQILFAANIPGFENVANLDLVPPIGAQVVALPMKITGGSGGPLRIIALLPRN